MMEEELQQEQNVIVPIIRHTQAARKSGEALLSLQPIKYIGTL
jgi:hypothetical protein